ncbi:hypothetical protein [Polyangium sorediatum]|uniref:Chitin-binding type-2 domain-containing protein n=1 Tax=Polyangium sorediatum TaxID=889274 RepID=A0ABT6P1H1_9BACT|nr:hypothetical protein [Polyangium sorediatum]MDI1434457.1 hypothetical protein [Polyangium sorediatum]
MDAAGRAEFPRVLATRASGPQIQRGGRMNKKGPSALVAALVAVLGLGFSAAAQDTNTTGHGAASGEDAQPSVTPPPGCVYQRTLTKCYVRVKFCNELYLCPNGKEWWRGWRECGTCRGGSEPRP